jgi:hypothetical protein
MAEPSRTAFFPVFRGHPASAAFPRMNSPRATLRFSAAAAIHPRCHSSCGIGCLGTRCDAVPPSSTNGCAEIRGLAERKCPARSEPPGCSAGRGRFIAAQSIPCASVAIQQE